VTRRPIRIGVHLAPQHVSFEVYRNWWLQSESLGVDVIFNWDHFFPLDGDPSGTHFEAWTTLAVLGSQLQRAHAGTLVTSIGYRNPALLSAMARTLDRIMGGRLILGVGAGWFERDYAEYGYEFGSVSSRLQDLEKGLEIINERWAKDNPPPVRGRVPILIGGAGEKTTLRIVARFADLWHTSGPIEWWFRKNAALDDWCAAIGRDPTEIERTVTVQLEEAGDRTRLDEYATAGATVFIYHMNGPRDTDPVRALLAWRDTRGASSSGRY